MKYIVNPIFQYSSVVSSGIEQRIICKQAINLLREERERRGLSKYALSAECGLSQQSIGYIERGLRHPSFETVLRLADGMGVKLEDILIQARALAKAQKP